MATRVTIAVTISLLAGATATSSLAQPRTVESAGTYVHGPTGMSFPRSAGDFRRLQIFDYSGKGEDVSASYRTGAEPNHIVVTVYIYPGLVPLPSERGTEARERACNDEFESVAGEVARHPGALLVEKGRIPSPSANHRRDGMKVVFTLDSLNGRAGPLRSEADLFCHVGRRWSIKYRTTTGANVAYQDALDRLMHDLAWPLFPQADVAILTTPSYPSRIMPASAPRP